MKNRRSLKRAAAALLSLFLSLSVCPLPAAAAGAEETITLYTVDDLLALQKNCSYDAWSRNKRVVLANDISLSGVENFMIPSFSGSFEGGGHRILDFTITGEGSPAGFFGILREEAQVSDLRIEGNVTPAGTAEDTGGIAGINYGSIRGCSFYGTVSGTTRAGGIAGTNGAGGRITASSVSGGIFGRKMTGGIAGSSHGSIYFSTDNAYINTRSIDPGLSVNDLHLDLNILADLSRIMSMDSYNVSSDTGGIAGYTDGMILGCVNYGTVGYQHIGYNVGGIAGRSRGLISGARNLGAVYGRKDVGGIAGMAEPDVSVSISPDQLDELQTELHTLSDLVDAAAADADETASSAAAQLSRLSAQISTASANADQLAGQLKTYGNDTLDEVNRGSSMLNRSTSDLYDVVSSLDSSAAHLTGSTDALRDAIREAEAAGVNAETLAILQEALEDADRAREIHQAGMDRIRQGNEILRSISEAGPGEDRAEMLRQGAGLVREGLQILRSGRGGSSGDAGGSIYYINEAMALLSQAEPDLNGQALEDVRDALTGLRSGLDDLGTGISDTESLLRYLTGEDPLYFPPSGEEMTDSADRLQDSLQQISGTMAAISSETDTRSEQLTEDIRKMNEQIRKITDLTADHVDELRDGEPGSIVEDSSGEVDPGALSGGKLILCRNEGSIAGDLNTGGIAGSMAIFDELDPEEDNSSSLSSAAHHRYELRCVLMNCTNTGEVSARRSNAGGICGFGRLGMIYRCVNDSRVLTENGDYAGGIAGCSDNLLRSCWSKTRLSGRSYLGGILGGALAGTRDSADGSRTDNSSTGTKAGDPGSTGTSGTGTASGSSGSSRSLTATNAEVDGCTAITRIEEGTQYLGAVAGADLGSFKDNRFTADDLAGINGTSYAGRAEPVSYKELLASDPLLPTELKRFRLEFTAEDTVIKSETFAYGDSFDASVFPEIPAREGCFARWDTESLQDLHHDTTVTAVYTPYVTALRSEATRSEARPVFFAEGSFDDRAELTAEPAVLPFAQDRDNAWQTLRSYNREILEQWHLEIPDDGAEVHRIRYLLPTGSRGSSSIYLRTSADGSGADGAGSWQKLETGREGSYMTFELAGSSADLTVLTANTLLRIWVTIGLLLAAIAALILRDIHVRRTAGRKQKQQPEGNAGENADENADDKAGADPGAASEPDRLQKLRGRLRRHAIAILALALVLGGTVTAYLHFAPGIADGMGLYLMLRNYFERSDVEMDLDVQADLGSSSFRSDVSMYTASSGGQKVTAVDWQGIPIYYCNGVMILENGKAYRLDTDLPDYSSIAGLALPLFRSMQVSSSELNGVRSYHAEAEGADARRILITLVPGLEGLLPETTKVDVDLVTTDTDLSSITFHWDGLLNRPDPAESNASVHAVMQFHSSTRAHTVPQLVESVIRSGDAADIRELTEDFKRLFAAFTELSARDPLAAEAAVEAGCGPFSVNEAFGYQKTGRYGKDISRLSRDGILLYASDGKICTEGGLAASTSGGYLTDTWTLFEMAYSACMKGDPSHTEMDGFHSYRIDLDADAIRELAEILLPEARTLPTVFEQGNVTAVIRDTDYRLESIQLEASGEAKIAVASVPVSMKARIRFLEGAQGFEVPEAVLEVLK